MLGVPQTRELGRDEGKCIAGYARICERKTRAGKRKKMGVPSHGEGKPKTRETALQKDETSLGLGAVARRRACQADGSSDEFFQLPRKKRFFWPGTRSDRRISSSTLAISRWRVHGLQMDPQPSVSIFSEPFTASPPCEELHLYCLPSW